MEPNGHLTLWQLPAQAASQMNSYVMRTGAEKIIVIDGGLAGDAPYLKGFLAALGGQVDTWFITHPHFDHVDALTAILNDPGDLGIGRILGSLPEEDWIARHEPEFLDTTQALKRALGKSGRRVTELSLGQVIETDGVRFEILGIKNPEITADALNNSSIVMRAQDADKSILFPGDAGVPGGRKVLEGPYRDRLRADYVQMSHHGQNGVDEAFYQAVRPTCCLWPTPRWQWENDAGEGPETGPWRTREVREWMEKLNVQKHYVSADGLCRID